MAMHAIESTSTAMAFATLDAEIIAVNPAFATMWRLTSPEAASGRRVASFWESPEEPTESVRLALNGIESSGFRVALREDGTTFIAEYRTSLVRDDEGRPVSLHAQFVDVTERRKAELALRESEERLKLVFDHSSDLVGLVRMEGDREIIVMANRRMIEAMRQHRPDLQESDVVGVDRRSLVASVGIPRGPAASIDASVATAIETREPLRIRTPVLAGVRTYDCSIAPIEDDGGRVTHVLFTFHDVTTETIAQGTLRSAQELLLHTESVATIGSWDRNLRTGFARWSPGMYRLFGLPPNEPERPTPATVIERAHPDDRERVVQLFAAVARCEGPGRLDARFVRPDETTVVLRIYAHCETGSDGLPNRSYGFAQDVTEQERIESRIRAQLEEKEVLLREVHHRVKNNLQIVSSLLYLQRQAIATPDLASALDATRGRIAAMALVHEKLYSADDLGSVDMAAYGRDLGISLFSVFGVDGTRIALEVEDSVFRLELDRAIPCGLVLNELLTNALKHAFPGDRAGTVRIRFLCSDDELGIEVADDGAGFSPRDGAESTLGLKLLPRLAGQLRGTIVWANHGGTCARMTFPAARTDRFGEPSSAVREAHLAGASRRRPPDAPPGRD